MKTGYIILFLFCFILVSCGEDRRPEYAERVAQSEWIRETMLANYYWDEAIPEPGKLNFHQTGETFFKSLLSSADKYSTIEKKSETPPVTRANNETSYGFEFHYVAHPEKKNALIARVLYTLPDSPASIAGLKRGDWIVGMRDTTLTTSNKDSLYRGNGIKLHIGYLAEEGTKVIKTEPVVLSAAITLEDNPIYYHSIIEHDGKKIGYLVYNSFTSGKSDTDISYLNQLSALSTEFKSAGVEEFVLDLRYNPGGELNRPVPMMCTMLAPATAMGKLMGYTERNETNNFAREEYKFDEKYLLGGSNLNLSRVYILVNSSFTASASEAVINFLKPYMDEVILIGTGTIGKNVASMTFDNDLYNWILHPIVAKVFNAEESTDYQTGFTPTYKADELVKDVNMLPLGDPNELLLSTALSIIDGSYVTDPEEETRSLISGKKIAGSSLDRKSLPGVIIR